VPAKRAATDPLFATTWVHVYEEDTDEGAVYRPEEDNIPLSRRPRERLRLQADGSAMVLKSAADDRPAGEPATWSDEDGAVVIRPGSGKDELRVVRQSPSRLVVRSSSAAES
jgi:hypothetical protein